MKNLIIVLLSLLFISSISFGQGIHIGTAAGILHDSIAAPFNYVIQKIGTTFYARPALGSKFPLYSGSDPTAVIQSAINALTPSGSAISGGGHIVLMDSSYSLTDNIYVHGWTAGATPSAQLILEGKSTSTEFVVNTSGKNGFIVDNGASVIWRNISFNVGSSAKAAIIMDSTGANTKMSCYRCELNNVNVFSSSTASPGIVMRNFYYTTVPYLYIKSFSNTALQLENTSASNNFGNSHFGLVVLDASSSASYSCLAIKKNGGGSMDHLTFDNLNLYDGYYGIWTDYLSYSTFGHIDAEYVGTPLYLGASSGSTVGNVFTSAFITSANTVYTAVTLGINSYRNTFNDFTIEGGSSSIVPISDASINQEPNSFNNWSFDGADYSANISINNPSTTPLSYKIWTGAIKQVLPNITTATTQANGDNSGNVATTAYSDQNVSDWDLIRKAMGSTYQWETPWRIQSLSSASSLNTGVAIYYPVYVKKASTITGIQFYMYVQGSYTNNNTNQVGLFTYSSGTLTKVAASADNSTLWAASAGTFPKQAFTGTYAAAAGLYYVGILYNSSAQVTQPQIGGSPTLASGQIMGVDFTNSSTLVGTKAATTSLPSSIAMSTLTKNASEGWIALY